MKKYISPILLFITALIWGTAFVAQKEATSVAPFALGAARSAIATVALIPIVMLFDKISKNKRRLFSFKKGEKAVGITLRELVGGVICGAFLFIASTLQQAGMTIGTDAGKASFITALYVVAVPLFGLLLRRRSPVNAWLAVAVAVVGFYLLCIKSDFSIATSDLLIFFAAFAFALQIIAIDLLLPQCDGARLSLIQFATVTVLSFVCALIFDGKESFAPISECVSEVLFLGICSSGIAYTLQIIGQKGTHPAVASVILSLESVFGALASAIILKEVMSAKEYIGCAVVFVAVVLSQLDFGALFGKSSGNEPKAKKNTEGASD